MKVLKVAGIALLIIVIVLAIVSSMQPAQGHVEESIVVNAPPATVFKTVNSFKSLRAWSPWAKMDPAAKYTMEGPEEGVGAKISWDGEEVGKGSQWIEESVENQRVKTGLAFEGYDGKAYAEFIIAPEGDGTKLTWTYDGVNDGLIGKAMWMMMGGMMKDWYSQGLKDLKQHIESLPAETTTAATPQ